MKKPLYLIGGMAVSSAFSSLLSMQSVQPFVGDVAAAVISSNCAVHKRAVNSDLLIEGSEVSLMLAPEVSSVKYGGDYDGPDCIP